MPTNLKFSNSNPKFETNLNDQKDKMRGKLDSVSVLVIWIEYFRFVSDFELRISDFDNMVAIYLVKLVLFQI